MTTNYKANNGLLVTLLLLFSIQFTIGQTREFVRVKITAIDSIYSIDSLDVIEIYRLDSLTFTFGRAKRNHEVKNIVVTQDKTKQIIFKSTWESESYIFKPTFFKPLNANDKIIILTEIGTEYSWGNIVYCIQNNQGKELGLLNLAADTNDNPENIALFTEIEENFGEIFRFGFRSADKVILNPGGHEQKSYKGNEISFITGDKGLAYIVKRNE